MWTAANRPLYERKGLRYPSDLTDDEWALAASLIPPAKHGGRKREINVREVLNGIFYVAEAANGAPCPRTCRPGARCMSI